MNFCCLPTMYPNHSTTQVLQDPWVNLPTDELVKLVDAAERNGSLSDEMDRARQYARQRKSAELSAAYQHSDLEHLIALVAARSGDFHALWGFHLDPNTTSLLDARNKYGHSCAHIACVFGHFEIIRQLHEMGKSDLFEVPDGEAMTSVHHAADKNQVAILEFFGDQNVPFENKDKYGRTPIHIAAQNGHVDLISIFSRRGVNFSHRTNRGKTVAHFAAKFGHVDFLRRLIDLKVDLYALDNDGRGLIAEASISNKPDIIRLLVTQHGQRCTLKDNMGLSPAHWAGTKGHPQIIQVLSEVSGRDSLILRDRSGKTPLHLAAKEGKTDVILAFENLGFDARVSDLSQNTPVHLAAQHGYIDALKALVRICPLDERNKSGKTPAHLAALFGKTECVGFLAVNGVDVLTCRDNDEKLPIDLAIENDHRETVMALEWITQKLRLKADTTGSPA